MGDRAAADALKNEGNKFFKNYEWEKAIAKYTEALAADATHHVSYSNRSQAYFNMGNFKAAAADGKSCIKHQPATFMKGYHRLANAQYNMDDYIGCLATCKAAEAAGHRGNRDIDSLYARVKPKAEKQQAAKKAALRGPARHKADGNDFFKVGRYEDAMVEYGKALSKIGDDNESLSDENKAIKISCLTNRALCYMQQQSYRNVIMDCTNALELDEHNFKALFRRASAYEGLEKYRSALADIRQCTYLQPGNKAANTAQHRLASCVRQLKAQGIKM